jgi:hypothetical protein
MLTYPVWVCWVRIGFYFENDVCYVVWTGFYDYGNGYMEEKTVVSIYFIEAPNLPINLCHAESNLNWIRCKVTRTETISQKEKHLYKLFMPK